MGDNLNLVKMFGLPKKLGCPKCKRLSQTRFADFDIECEEIKNGILNHTFYCEHCDEETEMTIKFAATSSMFPT